jgi:hypothetical protein
MFKSHHKQFEELVESWGLTPEQVDIEYFMQLVEIYEKE